MRFVIIGFIDRHHQPPRRPPPFPTTVWIPITSATINLHDNLHDSRRAPQPSQPLPPSTRRSSATIKTTATPPAAVAQTSHGHHAGNNTHESPPRATSAPPSPSLQNSSGNASLHHREFFFLAHQPAAASRLHLQCRSVFEPAPLIPFTLPPPLTHAIAEKRTREETPTHICFSHHNSSLRRRRRRASITAASPSHTVHQNNSHHARQSSHVVTLHAVTHSQGRKEEGAALVWREKVHSAPRVRLLLDSQTGQHWSTGQSQQSTLVKTAKMVK
ncbi:hypothetical protein DEO72_LG10g1525 [Vigna unguiculata]|uniref:Uncharacterized protein n=1 Tax=Vigna unguiculata TaxID=3917 RepID=A0A4D6NEG9_VIGUN|nr:hypothetical protein DEO72_LG10g1525 [Vigna unguiculata]